MIFRRTSEPQAPADALRTLRSLWRPAWESRAALAVTLAAMALSTLFKFAPVLSELNKGVAIMISAGGAALFGALLFPPEKEETA